MLTQNILPSRQRRLLRQQQGSSGKLKGKAHPCPLLPGVRIVFDHRAAAGGATGARQAVSSLE